MLTKENGESILQALPNDPILSDETEHELMFHIVSEDKLTDALILLRNDRSLASKILKNNCTPLHLAQSVNMANVLFSHNADINALDEHQETPLMHAVKNNNLSLVRFLVQKKANIYQQNPDGESAFSMAQDLKYTPINDFFNQKILSRAQKSQSKFFDYTRSKKPETQELIQKYTDFRTNTLGRDQAIKANNVPGRRLVTADAGAVAKTLYPNPPDMDKRIVNSLITATAIITECKFYNAGYKKDLKINKNWSWEFIDYSLDVDPGSRVTTEEQLTISSQYNPIPGHLGNFFMSGLGKYGDSDSKCILSTINRLTENVTKSTNETKSRNERKLADLLLNYIKNGKPVTNTALKNNGFNTKSTKAERVKMLGSLNRICYLAGIKEVTRRMHQGVRADGSAVEELPIGLAYVMSLQLISAGHLTMQQVFADQAKYGLPTATNISSQRELDIAKNKFFKLSSLFYSKNPQFHATREGMHQILLHGYGGESDTSGDEYESSNDESILGLI